MKRILIAAAFAVLSLIIALQRIEVERQYGKFFATNASRPLAAKDAAPRVLLAAYQEPPHDAPLPSTAPPTAADPPPTQPPDAPIPMPPAPPDGGIAAPDAPPPIDPHPAMPAIEPTDLEATPSAGPRMPGSRSIDLTPTRRADGPTDLFPIPSTKPGTSRPRSAEAPRPGVRRNVVPNNVYTPFEADELPAARNAVRPGDTVLDEAQPGALAPSSRIGPSRRTVPGMTPPEADDPLAAPSADGSPNVPALIRQLVRLRAGHDSSSGPIRELPNTETWEEESRLNKVVSTSLGQEFDARQQRYDEELKQLEAKVQKLKDLARRRLEARDQIIGRRLEQLLRDAEGLGW